MTNPAILLDDGSEIPEGIMDSFMTVLGAMYDFKTNLNPLDTMFCNVFDGSGMGGTGTKSQDDFLDDNERVITTYTLPDWFNQQRSQQKLPEMKKGKGEN